MSSPIISYLLLDSDNDPVFDVAATLSNAAAVQQAILTRLRLFQGEWWEDATLGLPVFQKILGSLSTNPAVSAIKLEVQRQIESVPYVTAVNNVVASFTNGQLSIAASVETQFGLITVNSTNGGQ